MDLSQQRAFASPSPGDDWRAIAARFLPDEPADAAIEKLKSWNLHLLVRNPPGEFTGSDVIFVEAPRPGEGFALPLPGTDGNSEGT